MAYDYPPLMTWTPMGDGEEEAPDMSGLASSLKKRFAKKPAMGAPEGHTDTSGNMGGAHEGMGAASGGGAPSSF